MVKKWTQVGDRIKNLRVKSGGLNSANDEQPWTQKIWLKTMSEYLSLLFYQDCYRI